MYRRILVPVDGSARALAAVEPARALAKRFSCDLELVHVATDADAGDEDLPDEVTVLAGDDVAEVLASEAAGDPPSLVCLSSKGRGAVAASVLGSVARSVVTAVDGPVVVIGPEHDPAVQREWAGRFVVGLDGSRVASEVLPTAVAWAKALQATLRLVHVVTPPRDDPRWRPGASMGAHLVSDDLERIAREVCEAAGVLTEEAVVVDADPATGLVHETGRAPSDLLMLATHGRSGLSRVVLGSVGGDAVRASPVPVALVRPQELTT